MNGKISDKKIRSIVARIVRDYKPDKVIIFGSYAWGKSTKDSDIDLLLVKKNRGDFLTEQKKVREIINGEAPVDVLIQTPEEINKNLSLGDFFFRDIINKGVYLYGKK